MAKILIIDDDPDITAATKLILKKEGFSISSAVDEKEGLKKAKDSPPDLIILDIMMTEMDSGIEASRQFKNDPSLAKVPILMFTSIRERTGFDFSNDLKDKDWLPVDDYIEKPIEPKDLVERVKKLLDK